MGGLFRGALLVILMAIQCLCSFLMWLRVGFARQLRGFGSSRGSGRDCIGDFAFL